MGCGQAVQNRMSVGQMDGTGLDEYADWVLGGFSGRPAYQRYRNQGFSLIHTKTPVLKYDICC